MMNERIKNLRLKASLTQAQLAERLGVSAQSISKWENGITMPDITLLPLIAEVFGISIDELFDLSVDQKLRRIENRIEIEEELSPEIFSEYEEYLKSLLIKEENNTDVLSLLAHLYHHRIESDSRKVSKYAREAIMLNPSKKDCQWLLTKAEGSVVWDWNIDNHSSIIDFYKEVILRDQGEPKSALPYYYLIDNLLADNRIEEAEHYLKIFETLPSANPVMSDVYKAYIALAKNDVDTADMIIESCMENNLENSGYLFEAAQYYARRCNYKKSIELYERCWNVEKKPRFTDALRGITTIYKILGDVESAEKSYNRILKCLKEEWGYASDDKPYIEVEREKTEYLLNSNK